MLTRLKNLFSGKAGTAEPQQPQLIPAEQYSLTANDISKAARNVVEILENAGFQAFLVGGCVRDLVLGRHPKDFDVATNATPEQAKKLFRRARIVGRRFRIVHVQFGREIVEVTTFRAHHDCGDEGQAGALRSDQGLLLRDNVFGDIREDASRRDFTVNALYYHPTDNTIIDYADGIEHIQQRRLQILGDPGTRFREDPVRMLRAVRFAAKLEFNIEPATAKALPPLGHLLLEVPPARLFDEFLKLFLSGHALRTFHLLWEYGLFAYLFPLSAKYLTEADSFFYRFIEQALINTDLRISNNMRVTPAFLLAALLWPAVQKRAEELRAEGSPAAYALQQAGAEVTTRQVERVSIPRRFSQPMREIWDLQWRLPNRQGNRAERMLAYPRFRAAYDFVLLREQAGEELGGLGQWWTAYQDAGAEQRQLMVDKLRGTRGPGSKRSRRSGRSRSGRSGNQARAAGPDPRGSDSG